MFSPKTNPDCGEMVVEHEHGDKGFSDGDPMDDTLATGLGSLSIETPMSTRVPNHHLTAPWTPTPVSMPPPPLLHDDKTTGRRRTSAKQRERSVVTAKAAAKVKGIVHGIVHMRNRKTVRFSNYNEEGSAASSGSSSGGRERKKSILKGSTQVAGSNDKNVSALKDVKLLTKRNTSRNESIVHEGGGESPVASTSPYSDELPMYRVFPTVDGRPHWMTVDKWIVQEKGELARRSVRCVGCGIRLVMSKEEEMMPARQQKAWKLHKAVCEGIVMGRSRDEVEEESLPEEEQKMDVSQ